MPVDLERLVLLAAQGDAESYGQLVNQTSPLVSSIALAIVRDLELSRDVAQDVFLAVWRDLNSLRNPASFLPWLRQVTRYRAKAALRTQTRNARVAMPGALEQLLPVAADPQPSAVEQLVAAEELQALAEALAELPEETREILTLFYREGQSVSQVASLLDLTEAAVRKRLSRARECLRSSLQQQIGDTLNRTRPGAEFTAVVLAALPSAAIPGATAATFSLSKLSFGRFLLLPKLPALLSGPVLGGLGAILGVLGNAQRWLREAQDEEERRGLRRHRMVSVIAMAFFAIALPAALVWSRNPWVAVPWFLCLILAIMVLEHVWRPRIVRRRFEAEMRQDPVSAAARRQAERRQAIRSWTLGFVSGLIGLLFGLWLILR